MHGEIWSRLKHVILQTPNFNMKQSLSAWLGTIGVYMTKYIILWFVWTDPLSNPTFGRLEKNGHLSHIIDITLHNFWELNVECQLELLTCKVVWCCFIISAAVHYKQTEGGLR